MSINSIEIYTDGSSRGNPGPGGYGVVLKFNGAVKELAKGFRLTTNNRMELLAVIEGLRAIKTTQHPIRVFSDSKYVIDAIEKGWLKNWIKTGFKGKKNKDLWLKYHAIAANFNISFTWVKGHNGHPENERCDVLAVQAATGSNLGIDSIFEATNDALDNTIRF
jgi:ribonuclease HI